MKNLTRTILFTLSLTAATSSQALTFDAFKDGNAATAGNPAITQGIVSIYNQGSTGTGLTSFAYIGFDITDFTNLATEAASATLSLFSLEARTNLPLNIYGLNDNVPDNWTEASINTGSAPGLSAGLIDASATTLLYSSNALSHSGSNAEVTFSTSDLVNFINADTDSLITLILGIPTEQEAYHDFNSRSSFGNPSAGFAAYAPSLEITPVSPVPLPAAFWLFASGIAGLFAYRKKA